MVCSVIVHLYMNRRLQLRPPAVSKIICHRASAGDHAPAFSVKISNASVKLSFTSKGAAYLTVELIRP